MLYIISQDGTHYGSSDITLKGKEIYQEGIVIGAYHDENKAKEVFGRIIALHKDQNIKHAQGSVATLIYQMPLDDMPKKVEETPKYEKVVEEKKVEQKPTQEKKPQVKKASK